MSAAQGTTATLVAQFYQYSGGPAADVTNLTVTIKDPTNATVIGPTGVGITHPSTGVYRYSWAVSANAVLGDYLVVWDADGGVQTTELVTVTATATATWATESDVFNITGVTVDGPTLMSAQATIETYVDIDPADPGMLLDGDRERLRKAHAFQAAFQSTQIEIHARTDIIQNSQDGNAFTYANPDAAVLAPLAKRNIDRLSWNQSGAVGGARFRRGLYSDWDAVRDAVLRDEIEFPGQGWQYEADHL